MDIKKVFVIRNNIYQCCLAIIHIWPNSTQPNPTHGSTQPMAMSEFVGGLSRRTKASWVQTDGRTERALDGTERCRLSSDRPTALRASQHPAFYVVVTTAPTLAVSIATSYFPATLSPTLRPDLTMYHADASPWRRVIDDSDVSMAIVCRGG